jgi:hypothetical protein
MGSVEERWIDWWCAPWKWAHPGWTERFIAISGLPHMALSDLPHAAQIAFLSSVGIQPSQPPMPVPALLQWLALQAEQQQQALALADSICLARSAADQPHSSWCRAVAKALRPGAWLAPRIDDPRLLLAAWAGDTCWSRLRLNWPPDAVAITLSPMPANKLQTLWESVLWRVMTP